MNKLKHLFLDRDGVINKKAPPHEYVTGVHEFEFLPGTISALKQLSHAGYVLYVISNQAGIARGKMKKEDVEAVHEHMKKELEKQGISIAGIAYCPHGYDDNCVCRKPKPGLIHMLSEDLEIDLSNAVLVGDSESDILAGESAGIKKTILVSSEEGIIAAVPHLIKSA